MKNEFNEIGLRRLDLNLLLVFAALMRERSVARAAQRLRLGASAVSMALGRLRDALGDELFVRAGRGVAPTPAAEALWGRIEPLLTDLNDALRSGRPFDPAAAAHTFRLALPDDLEFVLVPMLLAHLAEAAPGIRLSVRPTDFRNLFGRLDEGDADLALIPEPPGRVERRHRIAPLYADRYALLFDSARVDVQTLATAQSYLAASHVVVSRSGSLADEVDARLGALGLRRNVVAAVSHYPTLPFILRRLPLVANVPHVSAAYLSRAYALTMREAPIELPTLPVALAWHARSENDGANMWMRALLTKMMADVRKDAAVPAG